MVQQIDVYGIARLYVKEYGHAAIEEIGRNIARYAAAGGDSGALKAWYEIEEAAKEILCASETMDAV